MVRSGVRYEVVHLIILDLLNPVGLLDFAFSSPGTQVDIHEVDVLEAWQFAEDVVFLPQSTHGGDALYPVDDDLRSLLVDVPLIKAHFAHGSDLSHYFVLHVSS